VLWPGRPERGMKMGTLF